MSIKAIVFDYGNVISIPQDPKVVIELAKRAGVAREKFESLLWPLRNDYDRGLIEAKEYYQRILSGLGISLDDKSIDEMITLDLESWKNINIDTVALMEEIKKAGYILGILSNMPFDFLAWAREKLPVFSLPHISVYSCEVQMVKPEKAIFEKIISLAGVKERELVFFDDKAENIKGARDCGIEAFLWENPDCARRQLESLGVRL